MRHEKAAVVLALALWFCGGCGKTEPKVATPPPAVTATAPAATPTYAEITDDDVRRAIERGWDWLVNQQKDGLWPEQPNAISPEPCGTSELAAYTMAVCGPADSPQTTAALDALLKQPAEKTYAVSMRLLALAQGLSSMKVGPKWDEVRQAIGRDATWLVEAQGKGGGWGPASLSGGDGPTDLGHTHMALVALNNGVTRECCVPAVVWQRAREYFSRTQQPDGSWPVVAPKPDASPSPGYGPATAAGIDGLSIIADNLALWPGAPGATTGRNTGFARRIDLATQWIQRDFEPDREADVVLAMQNRPGSGVSPRYYWLYAAGRAATQIGYAYLGNHDWYAEGAADLVARQQADGSWGDVPSTCLAMLFLRENGVPVLFNKVAASPGGQKWEWNSRPRDAARATEFVSRFRQEPYRWQIVNLAMTLEDLHTAPILYISAATAPHFTAEEKKKLRAFTDTGGTIFVEAAGGSEAVRNWFTSFACDLWPEFHYGELQAEHPVFNALGRLKDRPALGGVDDGSRTIVFYSPDDVSTAWQSRDLANHEQLFMLAKNLAAYAAGDRPLHGRLWRPVSAAAPAGAAVKAGPKKAITLVRLEYDDRGWIVGRNYKGFEIIQGAVKDKAGIALAPNEAGTRPLNLAGADVAFMTGTAGTILPDRWYTAGEREALRQHLAGGGFLWAEATAGSKEFDEKFRAFAALMQWRVEPLPPDHPIMTGRFASAVGSDLTKNINFRRALKVERLGKPRADLSGIYQDGRLVGVYSPLDIVFSTTEYPAYGCRGYAQEDAKAVAGNILLYLSDRSALESSTSKP